MMAELALPVSPLGIARHYHKFINGLVIDKKDTHLADEIIATGIDVRVTNTIMNSARTESNLAQETLQFAMSLSHKEV